ncbi:MAG: hypothetical protein EpisKO_04530 [Epibacterium sp.]
MSQPTTLRRRPDWHSRLAAYLARVARLPFRPGSHDCVLFAAGAVEAMTGTDLAAEYRGSYRTLKDGQEVLKARGYADHIALVEDLFESVAPALAQVGDLAVVPGGQGERGALGIFQGSGVYVLDPSGLAVVDRLTAYGAFSV